MSLYALADHMAAKGRNGDTMLVHMAPSEVAGLHALALSHGERVTINPETGLPEMFSLKKLLKAVLPAVAGFALGPAGFGVMSSLGAAATVGGATALATGSLSRGLMAGLGAYGGAQLGEGLASLGSTAVSPEALAAANASADPIMSLAAAKDAATMAGVAAPTGFEAAKQGLSAAVKDPKAFMNAMGGGAKTLQAGYMAASPMMADEAVETKTKMPTATEGYYRPMVFDPRTGGLQQIKPIAYKDAYPTPPGGKEGGLMRLAAGGAVAFADGGDVDAQIKADLARLSASGNQSELDQWLATSRYTPEQMAAASGYNLADVNAAISGARSRYTPPQDTTVAGPGPSIGGAQMLSPGTVDQGYSRDYTPEQRLGINKAWLDYGLQDPQKFMGMMTQYGVNVDDVALSFGMNRDDLAKYLLKVGADPTFGGIDKNWDRAAQDQYLRWQEQQNNPLFHDRFGDMWRAEGITDPGANNLLRAQAQRAIDISQRRFDDRSQRGLAADKYELMPWLDPDWERKLATKRAEDAEYARMAAARDRAAGLVTGPGTPPPPPNPYAPAPPPPAAPPPPRWQDQPINRLPTQGPVAPEDAMTGRSLEAYNALMGQGSTATKQWDVAPMRPYLPQTPQQPIYIQRGDQVTTGGVPTTTTPMPGADPSKPPTEDPGQGMEWYWDSLNKVWLKRVVDLSGVGGDGGDSGGGDSGGGDSGGGEGGGMSNSGEGGPDGVGGWAYGGRIPRYALGGLSALAAGGMSGYNLGGYSDGGRLLKGPGDGVSDSIPATIGNRQPARLADGEFVVPARIVSELGNGSTNAGARKLYAMMDRVQKTRGKTTGKGRVAVNSRADKYLPA